MIPFFDLSRQYRGLRREFDRALAAVHKDGDYILGKEVKSFEKAFASYIGVRHGAGLGSGTDALIFSLQALGVGEGDEVILPSFTFVATAFAVLHVRARPVFVDVHPETFTLDPKGIEKRISRRTRVLLPVHLYGQCAEMDELRTLARKHRLKIVEDVCQAHGAEWDGKKAGALGDIGCFSFYPTKNLGAMGDGGMAVTQQSGFIEKIKRLRNSGRNLKNEHVGLGFTSRLDSLQAAILNVKLRHLERFIQKRRSIAQAYRRRLSLTPLILPVERERARHVYQVYCVRVPGGKRDTLRSHLAKRGIPTALYYSRPVHKQPFYRAYSNNSIHLPVTETLCREILSLPIFPEMKEAEVSRVCEAILSFYRAS